MVRVSGQWRWWAVGALCVAALGACGDDEAGAPAEGDNNGVTNNGGANNGGANNGATNNGEDNGEVDPLEGLPPQPWSVLEPGHFTVGYRTETVKYTPAGMERERRLRLALWYPSRESREQGIAYVGAPREAVFAEVAPAHKEPLPVLVFSHGSGGFAEQSYSMMEYFASHGWVVAAPDHTGNTFLDARNGIPPETLETRPQDISAVIDFLQALPAEDPLAPLISEDIVVSGHSFGGYTTLALSGGAYEVDTFLALCDAGGAGLGAFCDYLTQPEVVARFRGGFLDDRIKLGIPMAPFGGIVFGEGAGAIDVPILLMTARADETLPPAQDGDPLWDGLNGEADVRLDFVTGGHFTFSNGCELADTLGFGLGGDGCGPNFINVDQAFYVINAYSLAFARFHLWGDATDQALLLGERTLDATVQVFTKE